MIFFTWFVFTADAIRIKIYLKIIAVIMNTLEDPTSPLDRVFFWTSFLDFKDLY